MAGDKAREAGDHAAAITKYRESHALDPEVWTTIALAGALVATGEHVEALGYFREALATHRSDPQIDIVASRGESGALEAMGQGKAALAVMDSLAARRPSEENDRLRDELKARLAVRDADELRITGRYADAQKALEKLAVESGNQPLVQAAWAALLLDLGRPKESVDAAARALAKEPTNPWALDVAKRAGRSCGCSDRVVQLYRVAVAGGGGDALAAELRRVKVSAAIEAALAAQRARKPGDVAEFLREARAHARGDAEGLLLLAQGERQFGHEKRARAALRKAWLLDPEHPEVLLAVAEDMAARGKRNDAIELLESRWATAPDHRVGETLARLRAQAPPPAAAKNGRKASTDTRTDDEELLLDENGDPIPARRAPTQEESERLGPDPEVEEDEAPEDLTVEDAPSFGALDMGPRSFSNRADARVKKGEPAVSTVGFGMLSRSGVTGIGKEIAGYIPVHLGPPPVGPVQLDVEAVVVRVEDGASERWGVAPSIGAATPLDKPWAAWLRAGMSPLGFNETPYPVWFLGGRGRIGTPLAVGLETGRAPMLDSYASWVGGADIFSGQPFGQVHHTWFGGWAGVGAPWGTDLGVLSRLGQSEGLGLEPVGRFEVVTWLGQRIGTPSRNVRIGAEGVGFSHERQVDGFQVGQGAIYSPPVFGVATGRLDVRWTAFEDRFSVCGGVGAGMQYAGGGPTPWFMPGTTFTHNGRVRLAWRTPSEWGVMVEGSWLQAGPWHQETALVRFGRSLDGSPPLTTFATPSAGLTYQGEGC
ncbi:MAG: cellulose synthase subunit BcsC-related outer membrane protein [Myxococcota bacterium]